MAFGIDGTFLPMIDTAGQNYVWRQCIDYSCPKIDIGPTLASAGFNYNSSNNTFSNNINNNTNTNNSQNRAKSPEEYDIDRAVGKLTYSHLVELQDLEKAIKDKAKAKSELKNNPTEAAKLEKERENLIIQLEAKEREYLELDELDTTPTESQENPTYEYYTNIAEAERVHMNDIMRNTERLEEKIKSVQEALDMLTIEKKSYDMSKISVPPECREQYTKLCRRLNILSGNRDKKLANLSAYIKTAIKDNKIAKGTGIKVASDPEDTDKSGINPQADSRGTNASNAPKEAEDAVKAIINKFDPEKKSAGTVIAEIKDVLYEKYNDMDLQDDQKNSLLKMALKAFEDKKPKPSYGEVITISQAISSYLTDVKADRDFVAMLAKAEIERKGILESLEELKTYVEKNRRSSNLSDEMKDTINCYIGIFADVMKDKSLENNSEVINAIKAHGGFKLLGSNETFESICNVPEERKGQPDPAKDKFHEEALKIVKDYISKKVDNASGNTNLNNIVKSINMGFDSGVGKQEKLAEAILNNKDLLKDINELLKIYCKDVHIGDTGEPFPDRNKDAMEQYKKLLENVLRNINKTGENKDKIENIAATIIKIEKVLNKQTGNNGTLPQVTENEILTKIDSYRNLSGIVPQSDKVDAAAAPTEAEGSTNAKPAARASAGEASGGKDVVGKPAPDAKAGQPLNSDNKSITEIAKTKRESIVAILENYKSQDDTKKENIRKAIWKDIEELKNLCVSRVNTMTPNEEIDICRTIMAISMYTSRVLRGEDIHSHNYKDKKGNIVSTDEGINRYYNYKLNIGLKDDSKLSLETGPWYWGCTADGSFLKSIKEIHFNKARTRLFELKNMYPECFGVGSN